MIARKALFLALVLQLLFLPIAALADTASDLQTQIDIINQKLQSPGFYTSTELQQLQDSLSADESQLDAINAADRADALQQQQQPDVQQQKDYEQSLQAKGTPQENAASRLNLFAGGLGFGPAVPLPQLIGRLIQGFLALAGTVLVLLIIYAGWLWMSSQGEEEKIEKSKSILRNAIIGLAIVLSAYAITSFVINSIASQPTATPSATPP